MAIPLEGRPRHPDLDPDRAGVEEALFRRDEQAGSAGRSALRHRRRAGADPM